MSYAKMINVSDLLIVFIIITGYTLSTKVYLLRGSVLIVHLWESPYTVSLDMYT
jgi:hypothetical protein